MSLCSMAQDSVPERTNSSKVTPLTNHHLYLVVLILILVCGCRTVQPQQPKSMKVPSLPSLQKVPLRLPIEKPRITVYKSERRLEFYSDQTLLRSYRVGLGFNPVADKQREGDGATPEGEFY